jgi:hypothetical protein
MKYIELVKGLFTADHEARAKQEEPYIAYSKEAGSFMFTIVPEPVTGPADNEIWYTTSDKTTVGPESAVSAMPGSVAFGVNIISNTYDGDKGIIVCDNPILAINGGTFIGVNNLTSLVLPNSITELRSGSIQDCSGLTEITLSKNLKITQSGILSRTDLREVEFPDGFEQLGMGTLAYCNNLSKVILPGSITSISIGIFPNWPKTTNIIYKGTKEQLLNIVAESENNRGVTIHCIDGDIVL